MTQAIAKSAGTAGADIVTGKAVKVINKYFDINFACKIIYLKEIMVSNDGKSTGVLLEDGSQINANVVLSNATPRVTFEKLISESSLDPIFLKHR